jgi:hypothetical protein
MTAATPFFAHSAEQATWLMMIVLPSAAAACTWLCGQLLHRLSLQWLRFKSYRAVSPRYNADAAFGIEAPTCTALLSADDIATQLCTPYDYLTWLNPQQALQKMAVTHRLYCEETVDALMESTHPTLWAALPPPLRAHCYAHAQRYITPFLDDVLDDLIENAEQLFNFTETIRTQLKQQQFDQTANFLLCLQHNSETLMRQFNRKAVVLSILLTGIALIIAPTLGNILLEASNALRLGIVFSFTCASLWLAALISHRLPDKPSRRNTALAHQTTDTSNSAGAAEAKNTTVRLPAALARPAQALSKMLAETLLDIPSQMSSLKMAPKRSCLERIITRRFKQWFIDTLPPLGLKHHFAQGGAAQLLCEEASFQCIQAMDRPFDDPEFINHCTVKVQQALADRLEQLSGKQFSVLLEGSCSYYRSGRLIILGLITLFVLSLVTPAIF